MYMADLLTTPASVAGLPAISVPCGFSKGLPCGLQVIGNYYNEKLILEVAGAYEANTEWHKEEPEVNEKIKNKNAK
jgi:aspartyl-tRNA(Asn)/glutamyl-tRNA(Gln) amidotransferase subunit A